MPIQTVDHGDHQHTIKEVKENIFGIEINTEGHDGVSEAFGWKEDDFSALWNSLEKFKNFQHAAEELQEDLPKSTRISVLADYLKSNYFKQLAIKIETPNDYFMLGCIWSMVCTDRQNRGAMLPMGAFGGTSDLIKMLDTIFKK